MVTPQITIGTTPAKLYDLLKGRTPPVGASISAAYPEIQNGCQILILEGDPANAGSIFTGGSSGVSSTNKGLTILAGDRLLLQGGSGKNTIELGFWIVASEPGQILNVTVIYG